MIFNLEMTKALILSSKSEDTPILVSSDFGFDLAKIDTSDVMAVTYWLMDTKNNFKLEYLTRLKGASEESIKALIFEPLAGKGSQKLSSQNAL